ncbi:MAG: hypothetical protein A2509_04880 [Candidatus Edwardsbacteria bacterium RIFOXYD12_FULL_50_11]|uniref:Bacterial transcriptional activator domain-containing protein n=1 Tax=Candidatus Edwardsbacteria bacterium GWF2_54_11 TaxID=1817851 RepID=A0A1F5RIJ8_9BACT|nr:MAG: hypothetical protein A2502_01025 [Candidatus Edwardsbacteria bacterium RifOxyC12_full_54_24]OGF06120.1 MAG: hypothetical protein A2273_11155 [Candidatus Edwardsbacteria bacterium RifOxyA12_full_54_48]OGF12613.1 MAG: hypothetical protein A3K15_02115 [Candidatus Edwardsbacteria bacterium GWE2_54_12]OGF13851.1 MAG: hypothetical protein A2024_10395 [Candidatus Edwardsbacteria bacterium GWF2_54_11]OGF17822.1 MAG: hypothetical protein A2509_04880 [Candidatus Edwardsbacteria bacterium RIFOXYD1
MPKKTNDIACSITEYLSGKQYDSGVRLLIEHSRDLLQPGRLAELKKLLAMIPREHFLRHPKLILIAANADYQSGELKSALRYLTTAIPVLKKARDRSSLSAAYRYLSYIHQDMGQNQKAISDSRQGLKYLEKNDYRGRAGLLAAMAGSYWRLLDYKKASKIYAQVMDIYIRAGDKEGQIRTLANSSAITKALGQLGKARKEKEEVLRFYRDSDNRRSYCLAAVNLSSLYLEMFELEKAEFLLTSAIPEIQKLGLGMALGPARVYLGEVQMHQGRFPEAEKTLKFALDKTDSADEASYHFSCLIALSTLYRLQGNLSLSLRYALESLERTSPERPLDTAQAHYNISRVYFAARDFAKTLHYAKRSSAAYARTGMAYRQSRALLNLAEIYLAHNKLPAFGQAFSQGLNICRKGNYDFFFNDRYPDSFWPLIPAYLKTNGSSKYLNKLVEIFDPSKTASNRSPADPRPAITTLGSLGILLDGQPVERWKRTASRQVLGILLSRHVSREADPHNDSEQFIPSEVLSLMLWPKKSLASASINLQVAVAELRRLLEPGLKGGKNSRPIEFRNGCYRIDIDNISLDFTDFVAAVRKGQQAEITGQPPAALEFYRQAVEIYRGDFLPDVKLIEMEGTRERLRQLYFQALLSLAGLYLKQNRLDDAVKYAALAVSRERCLEEAHRILLSAYHRMGRKELISKQFQICQTALRRDLGLDVSPETIALYKECSK